MNDVATTTQRAHAPYLAPRPCVVTSRTWESHDTVSLSLTPPHGYGEWKPGQFNMLYLFGLGEISVSVSDGTNDGGRLVHTVKAVGPVSRALTELRAGDRVWVRGPYGSGWPDVPEGHDLIAVAGGIGLAPLMPAVRDAMAKAHARMIIVLIGARAPADVLFAHEWENWCRDPRVMVRTTVDRLDGAPAWTGSVGVVTQLLRRVPLDPRLGIVLTCGPEVMMRHVAADLAALGFGDDRIHVSLERNMKCAVGLCGRCQWGPRFVCRDGPIYRLADIRRFWNVRDY